MKTYSLTQVNKDQELVVIKEILKCNGYQQQIAHQTQKLKPTTNILHEIQKTKWATFTYYGSVSRIIKNYFETLT
jgi:hypothetical protein